MSDTVDDRRLIVAHVVWFDRYQGDIGSVRNVGHRFLQAQHDAEKSGEAHNFSPVAGVCYGYLARFMKEDENEERRPKKINIGKLGARANEDEVDNATVIFTATPAAGQNRVVVGWYESATVYRNKQDGLNPEFPSIMFYFKAPSNRCFLVPTEFRNLEIKLARFADDRDGPGNEAVYYPGPRVRKQLLDYLKTAPAQVVEPVGVPFTTKGRRAPKAPRQPDIAKRVAVELAAMEEVERVLDEGGWSHTDVSDQNIGWDISATRQGFRNMGVEVKGLSGSVATIELTRNEYEKLRYDGGTKWSDRYVVAIVTDALDPKKRQLQSFSLTGGAWLPFDLVNGVHLPSNGFHLTITEVTGARCSVVLSPRT